MCPCGSIAFRPLWVIFEDYEISAYSLNMECVECGSKFVTPTPVDKPGYGTDNVTV